ncbi:MAG: hypothetical protein DMG65_08625 [Candidatus Angelobacter sp. Gp1-AA117]|nr:MAG: hypothetical protein DMG65_08625 [Candidatus Angelobacter sp. Gp1-AA117]
MKTRIAILFVLLICLASSLQAKPKPAASHLQAAASQELSADQVQGLKDDLARMKALVQQMETNLSFVDTTQSPLKHQFQLEIDMWRMMIRQMERRLNKK